MKKPLFPWSRRAGAAAVTSECGWLPAGTGFIGATWYPGAKACRRRTAVLVVPGIAHEERTMAEGLSALARTLASDGFGTLMIDLRGTAQSSGRLDAVDIGERWRQDIRSAVEHLRMGGCESVIVVGVRVGALLAQDALQGEGVAGFVAWAPILSGRRHGRELKMLNAAAAEASVGETSDRSGRDALGGVSIAGHDIPEAVFRCLAERNFDPGASHWPMLLLSETGQSVADGLQAKVDGMKAAPVGGTTAATPHPVERRQAVQLQRWLFSPDDAPIVPEDDIGAVVDWCRRHDPTVGSGPPSRRLRPALLQEISLACDGLAVRERSVRIGAAGLSAIVSEPLQRQANGSARLLATLVGPGRIFPNMARADAALGKTSLRFDFAGFSSSGRRADGSGGELYSPRNREDVRDAVGWLIRAGHEAVSMVGFCAGGWSMIQAGSLPGVSGIVGINVALYRQPDYRLADLVLQPGHPLSKALSVLRSVAGLARAVDRIERRTAYPLEARRWLQRLGVATAPSVLLVYSADDAGLRHVDHRLGRFIKSSEGGDGSGNVARPTGKRPVVTRHPGLGHLMEGSRARGRALDAIAAYLDEVDRDRELEVPPRAAPAVPARLPARRPKAAVLPYPSHWEDSTWAHSR